MAEVPNGIETFMKFSVAWAGRRAHEHYSQTDRRPIDDRRTGDNIERTWTSWTWFTFAKKTKRSPLSPQTVS